MSYLRSVSDYQELINAFPSYKNRTRGKIDDHLSHYDFNSCALKSQQAKIAAIVFLTLAVLSLLVVIVGSGFITFSSTKQMSAIGWKIIIGSAIAAAASFLAVVISLIARYYLEQHKASKEELTSLKKEIAEETVRDHSECKKIHTLSYYEDKAIGLEQIIKKHHHFITSTGVQL